MIPTFVVPKETAQSRFNVCKNCDRLLKPTFNCKECGCFMKVKVKLSSSVCPLGKW